MMPGLQTFIISRMTIMSRHEAVEECFFYNMPQQFGSLLQCSTNVRWQKFNHTISLDHDS